MQTLTTDVGTLSWWLDKEGVENKSLDTLIDSVPVLIAYVSSDLTYQFVNKTFETWFRIPRARVVGRMFTSFLTREIEDLHDIWQHVLSGKSQSLVRFIHFPDGHKRWVKISAIPRFSESGEVTGFFLSCEDQTPFHLREKSLAARETQIKSILDNIVEGVVVSDDTGKIELFSRGAEQMFGHTSNEVIGKNLKVLMPTPFADAHDKHLADYNNTGKGHMIDVGGREFDAMRKDGTTFPIELVISEFESDNGRKFIGCIRDTSFRKESIKSLRAASSRLVHAMETERCRIARELHDDLSQRLSLFSVELELLGANLPSSRTEILEKLTELQARARQTTSIVHKMSHDLHPAILEQLGLASAISSYCREITSRSNIHVQFKNEGDIAEPSASTRLGFYRVVQEAIQNTLKHSGAAEATVRLLSNEHHIHIEIEDNGKGFENTPASRHGLGFISMNERMKQIGGTLEVLSNVGRGTRVVATAKTGGSNQ